MISYNCNTDCEYTIKHFQKIKYKMLTASCKINIFFNIAGFVKI